jgi:hypothetical protein
MIGFSEENIIKTTLAEITRQGFKPSGWGTVIECYIRGNNKIYWHGDKKVFFKNSTNAEPARPFKVIVAGSRYYTDYNFVKSKLDIILSNKKNIEIVSGACNTGKVTHVRPDGTSVCGADGLGERYAAEKGHAVAYFPANWEALGKKAGHVRNEEMAVYTAPDGGCVVFRQNMSPGSTSMAKYADQHTLKLKVYDF